LTELTPEEYSFHSPLIGSDIYSCIDATASVKAKNSFGGTSPEMVKGQIDRFKKRLRT
jgi:argininosuccinate lyase